jgi:sulfate transport system substrate-binding protein
LLRLGLAALPIALLAACGGRSADPEPTPAPRPATVATRTVHLVFAAFATPREAYETRILPAFQRSWRRQHGEDVEFSSSYGGSGSQTKAILQGLEADVAALSLATDLDEIARAGKIRGDWRETAHSGIVCRSLVAFAVRKGNPRGIGAWSDLVAPLEVIAPDPRSSGGGRWNLCAVYGAALRGHAGVPKGDPGSAQEFLGQVVRRVQRWDKDARESFLAFEGGAGDVALTSESEVIRGRMFGHDYELVLPPSTLRIDNPAAVLDANAEKHGVLPVALGLLDFLTSREAQSAYAYYGFRPVDEEVAAESAGQYPPVEDLWTIEDIGGWAKVSVELYGPQGVLDRTGAEPR